MLKFMTEVGIWLESLTKLYRQVMRRNIEKCSWKMKRLEEKISRQIYETQHGEVCEQDRTVLLFRETAACIFQQN